MSLVADLSRVRTEEDVKDAYIKALGLKKYNKGLIDIQTEEIWFEAKEASTPPVILPPYLRTRAIRNIALAARSAPDAGLQLAAA